MGFFKKVFKSAINPIEAVKNASYYAGKAVGTVAEGFGEGMAGDPAYDNSSAEAAAALAETEAEKKRKLKAAEELNPTGSLGTGNPTIKRSNILGA